MAEPEQKRTRTHVERLVEYISSYPPNVRLQVLLEMEVIDIIMVAQADAQLSRWMREKRIWRDVWEVLVIPHMIAKKIANTKEEALTLRLGDNDRINCIVWNFVSRPYHSRYTTDAFSFKHYDMNDAKVLFVRMFSRDGIVTNYSIDTKFDFGDELESLLPGSYVRGDRVIYPHSDGVSVELEQARIRYALLTLGYHFIVTLKDPKRTFYIRDKV